MKEKKTTTKQKKITMKDLKKVLSESGVPLMSEGVGDGEEQFKDFSQVRPGDVGTTTNGTEEWRVIRKGTVGELEKYSSATDTSALDPSQEAVLAKSIDEYDEGPVLWVYGEEGFRAYRRQTQRRWIGEDEGAEKNNETLPVEEVAEIRKLLIDSQNKLEEAARKLCNLHGAGQQIWSVLTRMDRMYEDAVGDLYRIEEY